jgi:tetratricopeptide (TPR) repeat protein
MAVFLSYRRSDSADALCLYPWLIQWFGRERVFWDRKDIQPGEDFAQVLDNQVRSSRAFIALMGDNWLAEKNDQGLRRIDSPEDWIRRETRLALEQGILVIPVLAGRAKCPRPEDLPDDLRRLAGLQVLSAGHINFHDLLRETLEEVMPAGEKEPAVSGEHAVRLQRRAGTLLRSQIKRLQVRAVELIQDRKLDRATDELTEGSELLMALLDLLPGDTSLDAQLGYLFGTTGQAFLRGGDTEKAESYFDRAMSVFQRVEANPEVFHERPADLASAIKGIGGVFYERGDSARAIPFYRRALEILDDYPEAWHDLFAAYNELAKQGTIDVPAMEEALGKLRAIGSGLGKTKLDGFEQILNGWRARAAEPPVNGGGSGKGVQVRPEALMVVITEADPDAAIFNLNCRMVNAGASQVTIESLKIRVTGPDQSNALFNWHWFYDFRPIKIPGQKDMTATGEAKPFEIAAGQRLVLGVQFTDPQSNSGRLWVKGDFNFELTGLYDGGQEFKTSFRVKLNAKMAGDVITLRRASKDFWDRFSDSDRAIGVPVQIGGASAATSTR